MALLLTDEFKLSINNDPKNCVLFVGAGLSASSVRSDGSGLPTWADLIKAMINDLQNSGKGNANSLNLLFAENRYLEIAEIFKSKKRPDQYSDFLKSCLDPNDLSPSKIHALILSIGFKGILTTNFDYVFETTSSGLSPLIYPQAFDNPKGFTKFGYFAKIHGCIKYTPTQHLILAEENYNELRLNQRYQTLLKSIFLQNTLLTVGFSLTDPDFLSLFGDIREIYQDQTPTIYSLIQTNDEQLKAFWRDKGVEIIGYDDHNEIYSFFSELKRINEEKSFKKTREFYDLNSDKFPEKNWRKFNTTGKFQNISLENNSKKIVWHLRAEEQENVGINLLNLPIKGRILFQYCIGEMNRSFHNIHFYVIPMKRGKLIEVGFDVVSHSKNPDSPYRQRCRVKNAIDTWISEMIEYDFSDLNDTSYVIFAPRINEGCLIPDKAYLLIRNVTVFERKEV